MPRAEHSQDLGESFRRRVEGIIKPLRYDVLASKYAITCKCEYHHTREHTIDTLARHIHALESLQRKAILIESKRTLPAMNRIEDMVIDIGNKIDCLYRHIAPLEIDEALVLTESDASLNIKEAFKIASKKIESSRGMFISLVSGSRFRILDGMSDVIRKYSSGSSITIIHAGKKPEQDLGSPCPLNIESIPKFYICGLKPPKFKISVFSLNPRNYNSEDFIEDMAWIKRYSGVFDQIHACGGFTDSVPGDVSSTRLRIGLVDHNIRRTFFIRYPNYAEERPR